MTKSKSQFEGSAAETPEHMEILNGVLNSNATRNDCRNRVVAIIRDGEWNDAGCKRPFKLGDIGTIGGKRVRVVAWVYVWNYDGDTGVIEQHYLTTPA